VPTCTACGNQGHSRSSRHCPSKVRPVQTPPIQAPVRLQTPTPSPSRQLQHFQGSPLSLRPSPIRPAPIRPTVTSPSPSPSLTPQLLLLAPSRPEVLIGLYLTARDLWLAENPTIKLAQYRKARKWRVLRHKQLIEQIYYMPRERRDLATSKIIAHTPKWADDEVYAWIDYDEHQEEEIEQDIRIEDQQGLQQSGIKGVWAGVNRRIEQDRERYII
jgi:hypothetical protein